MVPWCVGRDAFQRSRSLYWAGCAAAAGVCVNLALQYQLSVSLTVGVLMWIAKRVRMVVVVVTGVVGVACTDRGPPSGRDADAPL